VVATLWPIEDAAALTLLTAFYRHFAGGCGPAAALARMQREAARGDLGDDLKDPRHWAAYEIYGLQ
jgi:CHAT domain-containing protein